MDVSGNMRQRISDVSQLGKCPPRVGLVNRFDATVTIGLHITVNRL